MSPAVPAASGSGEALVVVTRDHEAQGRAARLAEALRAHGLRVERRRPRTALAYGLARRRRLACVVTVGPSPVAHAAGAALRRVGVPWVADHLRPWDTPWALLVGARLVRTADVATAANPAAVDDLQRRAHANALGLDLPADDVGHVVELARSWRAPPRGMRVLVIGPTNSPHVEDFVLALRAKGLEVFVAGLPWGGGLGPSKLPDAGVPTFSGTSPMSLWIRRRMRELRPTVVHAHWLPNAVTAHLGGARPLIATAWGSDVYLASSRRRAAYRWLLRSADAVLADSSELLAELQALGAPAGRSRVFSWGVDRDVFSPPAESQVELRRTLGIGDGPVLLSVRGFKPLYNQDVVIGAFERLAGRHPDLQLVLKHNSTEPPQLPALACPDRVHVVGPQPREMLARWFGAANVCVSLASSDSSPRSVWEAMACGCPCVISDLPWARQELEPDRHALVVPIDPEPVAAAIERLLDEAGLAAAVADAALAHVSAHHDRDVEMTRMVDLYRQLALSRRSIAREHRPRSPRPGRGG